MISEKRHARALIEMFEDEDCEICSECPHGEALDNISFGNFNNLYCKRCASFIADKFDHTSVRHVVYSTVKGYKDLCRPLCPCNGYGQDAISATLDVLHKKGYITKEEKDVYSDHHKM